LNVVSVDADGGALSTDRWLPADEEAPRVCAELTNLPFGNGVFDAAISISGLHTTSDEILQPATEVMRVIKTGGALIMTNDTPRGISMIMSDDYLMGGLGLRTDEVPVISFDKRGEIAEPLAVEEGALNESLNDICSSMGIDSITYSQYQELCEQTSGEQVYGSIFARAAVNVLQRGKGRRPFEWNSAGGSWNTLFFSQIKDSLKGIRFETVDMSKSYEIDPIDVTFPNGQRLFVSRMIRDVIGNRYYTDYSLNEVPSTHVDANYSFLVTTKA